MTSADFAPLPPGSPLRRFLLPAVGLSLGALYLLSRHALSPAPVTAVSGLLALGYLPGLAAAVWIERRFGLWASWILPLILSPVVCTAGVLLLAYFGVSPEVGTSWVVILSVAAVVFTPPPGHELEDVTVTAGGPALLRARADRHQVILIATFVLGVIAILLLSREWIAVTGSAAYQLAVTGALSNALPPGDPLFAGAPLRAPWAFAFYLDCLESVTRVPGSTLLMGGALIAAFSLVFSAYRAMTLTVLGHARALWGVLLLLLGLGGSFWVTGPLLDGVSMQTAAGNLLDLAPRDQALFPHAGAFLLEWLFRPGPHALGLVYFVLAVIAGPVTVAESRWRWNAVLFLAVLGLLLFAPAMAVAAGLTAVLLVPASLVVLGLTPWTRPGRGPLLLLVAWAAALLLSWPYLQSVGGVSGAVGDHLEVSWPRTRALLDAVGLELLFAAGPLIALLASREPRRQILAVWFVLFTAVVLGVGGAPTAQDPVSPLLLHVAVALLAGAGASWVWERTPRSLLPVYVVLLGALLAPRTVLGLAAYWNAPDPRELMDREAAAWIRRATPPDAVLVDSDWNLVLATGRRMAFPGDNVSGSLARPAGAGVTARATAHYSLLRGEVLSEPEYANLLALRAPVYVVEHAGNPSPHTPYTLPVHSTGNTVIYLWQPSARYGP